MHWSINLPQFYAELVVGHGEREVISCLVILSATGIRMEFPYVCSAKLVNKIVLLDFNLQIVDFLGGM